MSKKIPVSQLKEEVIFSVIPGNGGKVGIKNTQPNDRFVVASPIKREAILSDDFTLNGISSSFAPFSLYREGSRVYLQGRVNLKNGETYNLNNGDTPVLTLPVGYRPLKNQSFVTTCYFITDGGTKIWFNCVVLIKSLNGHVSIDHLGTGLAVDENGSYVKGKFVGTSDSTDPGPGGSLAFYINFDNISFPVEQLV